MQIDAQSRPSASSTADQIATYLAADTPSKGGKRDSKSSMSESPFSALVQRCKSLGNVAFRQRLYTGKQYLAQYTQLNATVFAFSFYHAYFA